jgi:pre-mRNA-processing factor 17
MAGCVLHLGYAMDPSVDTAMGSIPKVVGAVPEDAKESELKLKTVFESIKKRPKDNRKRERNDNPDDIEGFLGPWGGFVNEERVSKPSEVWYIVLIN